MTGCTKIEMMALFGVQIMPGLVETPLMNLKGHVLNEALQALSSISKLDHASPLDDIKTYLEAHRQANRAFIYPLKNESKNIVYGIASLSFAPMHYTVHDHDIYHGMPPTILIAGNEIDTELIKALSSQMSLSFDAAVVAIEGLIKASSETTDKFKNLRIAYKEAAEIKAVDIEPFFIKDNRPWYVQAADKGGNKKRKPFKK